MKRNNVRIDWRVGLKLILIAVVATVLAGIFGEKAVKAIYAAGLAVFTIYFVFSFLQLKRQSKEIRRIEGELNSLFPVPDSSKTRKSPSRTANAWTRHIIFIGVTVVLSLVLPKRDDLRLLLAGTCFIAIAGTGISCGNIVAGPKGSQKVVERSQSPKTFWGFATFYLAFGLILVGLAVAKFIDA